MESKLRAIAIGIVLICLTASAAAAQGTAFTYQGKLTEAGSPANGNYDLEFAIFDASAGGAQQGQTLTRDPVTASAGVFNVTLDFGANVFSGAARYLEIGVRPAGNNAAYTVLAPRQPISSSPYAIQTLNAQQLGGLPASDYVTTASVGNSFIKNGTAQQSGANLNISGNGFFDGNVGIGTVSPQSKLTVQTAGYGLTQTNGAVTLGTFISTAGGGSGWLGTKSNHPLNFFTSDSLPQMTLDTSGNVGIGVTPTTKLSVLSTTAGLSAIRGESATAPGVYGKSTSSRGVFGESTSFIGVWGKSVSSGGVYGESVSGSGVYGESAVASLTAAGVYGKGTGSGSIGVIGEANVDNAVGVFGVSSSPTGFGVYARNLSGGRAILVEGNVAQDLASGGVAKAMLEVTPQGQILRCYNGINNTNSGNCGITVTQPLGAVGVYRIDFGVAISHRFFSVAAQYFAGASGAGANYRIFGNTAVEVFTFAVRDPDNTETNRFILIMY